MGASALVAIFPARTKGPFFLSCPNPVILIMVLVFCIFTTVLVIPESAGSPLVYPLVDTALADGNVVVGVTWLYCIIWMFVLDLVKMGLPFALEPHVYRSSNEGGKGCRVHCWGCENMCGHDDNIKAEGPSEEKRITGPPVMHRSASFAPDFNDNLR